MALDTQRDATLDAEYSVLGAMLIDAEVVPGVLAMLEPRMFDSDVNRQLFEAIRALWRDGKPTDPISVTAHCGWQDDAEHRAYVAQLIELTPSSASWREHADIVRDLAALRMIRAEALLLASAGSLDACRAPIAAMTDALTAGQRLEARSLSELLTEFGDRQMQRDARQYITLGMKELDDNTFLERGDMLMLGGSPSDGKTALALQFAYHMSKDHNVAFYSLETSAAKLGDRLVATAFGISFDAIKKGGMTQQDWDQFALESVDAGKRRLTVVQAAGMTAEQITASSRARGYDVIVIDYGQLITPATTKNVTRAEQMAEVSRTLHTFAQTTRTLVVLLLQLSRKERNTKRERDMFDLGESSQFERDADLVLLLYRPEKGEKYDPDDENSEALDQDRTRILRIAKQKEGRRTRLPLAFDGDHQRFAVMQPDGRSVIRKYVDAGIEARERNHREALRQLKMQEIREDGNEPF